MNPQDIVEIIPHLYISNWDTSNNPDIISNYNINFSIIGYKYIRLFSQRDTGSILFY